MAIKNVNIQHLNHKCMLFGDIYKNDADLAEIWYSSKSCLDFHCSFVKLSEVFPELH